jgi:hypothetical protein
MFDKKWYKHEKRYFLHLPFHPDDPTAKPRLPALHNHLDVLIVTNRMIIAYHRPNNLWNLFFPQIFQQLDDRPVSTLLPCNLAAVVPNL